MKLLGVVLVLLAFYSFTTAQNQIDSLIALDNEIDATNENLIYNYRLPNWGYKRIYLDFNGGFGGSLRKADTQSNDNDDFNFYIRPYYLGYYESENIISTIQSNLTTYYNYSEQDRQSSIDTSESEYSHFDLDFNINGNMHKYFTTEWFLNLNSKNSYDYRESDDNYFRINNGQESKSKDLDITREFRHSLHLGLGYGRIRNVTPVFRALRFNDRLKNLDGNKKLDREDIGELAEFLTRRSVYSQIHDRSDKYFYAALPKNVLNRLDGLKPWELMYIDDVWDEIIGDRMEGYDINGGLVITYNKSDDSNPTDDSELFLSGLYLEHRYYHNLSPCYQIGTHFYSSISTVMNDNTMYDYLGRGRLQLFNLWNLADRMLLELDFGLESGFASSKSWERMDQYFTDLNFRYIIEDNLSANVRFSYDSYYNWPGHLSFEYDGRYFNNWLYDTMDSWNVNFNMVYYLERDLF